ncbi:P-loop containing nucleoside triphosphate hydrolase protein [Guyanagaster necrorhizus]|uniref:Guanine nucleotide-binding protein-like 1 n=1 Tax=Guyanagaster necrorhizus TaxID=856835 RepID=A0A9P8AYK1_9AGAR|nr:P-loop containing nucleoside triphosphate hydrolase protein [Guyanagaster necrorhizus MCA 3950]KAG7452301.1 P-loop containing nucleoside triphosphate hydrolase protein [Guyanagaster necrorhizus MCA 3950]
MPRRKPTSTRQKKQEQQLKRAIKRGDVDSNSVPKQNPTKRKKSHLVRSLPPSETTRKLQSTFVKLPPEFLEQAKFLAATLVLPRPIPTSSAILSLQEYRFPAPLDTLSCPKRPKWRYDMSKEEVERNEEGLFNKWLTQTDAMVERWQKNTENWREEDGNEEPKIQAPPTSMPRSTTYFERNIEVWRQFWRVTEISDIILVLLDSRCPLIHYPPSLSAYLSDRKHILVLTKVDITGPERVQAWTRYLRDCYPGVPIVEVEAYAARDPSAVHQGQKRFDPHLPDGFRQRLVQILQEVHAEMLDPPERVKVNPRWLKDWRPSVKREIDWAGVKNERGGKTGMLTGGPAIPRSEISEEQDSPELEPRFLTIGLIGQPNVGKSSLLNALFGTQKVHASKTPGKTKHFQTLFWTPEVRLVDCPGLVVPNFIPMELQVLSGILLISRISSIPSCIHFVGERLPIEEIYHLEHPVSKLPVTKDKRTWRNGEKRVVARSTKWTAMDVMSAYADKKGWVTAKAGRMDVNRAGNAILRALAETRIPWAFWPPDTKEDEVLRAGKEGEGIWILGNGDSYDDEASAADEEPETETPSETSDSHDDSWPVQVVLGRFAALDFVDSDGTNENS